MDSFLSEKQWQMSLPPQFQSKILLVLFWGLYFLPLEKKKAVKVCLFGRLALRFCRDDTADKSKSHSALS